jgi:putative spermidine/putrescine transport system substrate-binding protein
MSHRASGPALLVSAVVVIVATIGCTPAVPGSTVGPTAYDTTAAADQARTFHTLVTPNTYGNYGEQFTQFCQVKFGFDCNREDRDLSPGTSSSAEEVTVWDAEKNNPQSVLADLGVLIIPQAEQAGILADYQPPNVDLLPEDMHGPGWVATFVGVPTIQVNIDFLESHGLPIPGSWEDLTNPAYRSLIGMGRVGLSDSGTWAFVAMNFAAGGTIDNWQPGIDYAKRLLPNLTQRATLDTFEKGEVPISVRADFNAATWVDQLRDHGVNSRITVPSDGSVYAPSTLMINRYDVAHADFARMFMEWVLTDEAQVIFAKYGARPIRSVTGTQRVTIPEEAKTNWLPDEQYANVQTVDWRKVDANALLQMWENDVVGGT